MRFALTVTQSTAKMYCDGSEEGMSIGAMRRAMTLLLAVVLCTGTMPLSAVAATKEAPKKAAPTVTAEQLEARAEKVQEVRGRKPVQAEREAAAARIQLMEGLAQVGVSAAALTTATPGGVPDYFGTTPNWAYSPQIRKFIDELPGLGAENANGLGQYLSVAKPDTTTYPGSDYYEIELQEYTEQMHTDLPPTTLRGYVQVNNGTDGSGNNTLEPDPIHYLGPTIFATKDRPVRVKFTNKLATGEGGDLFLPVDTSVMGAGTGPTGEMYTQNRGTLHLHGGKTVWISDGTPHQWITPAGEDTPYPKGVSVKNVPDMPDPGDGSMTFFYSNQQSARMLWYHDHSFGITRLNVYAGEAAGYMLTDDTEQQLIDDGVIPAEQIPLIVQDKTFVDADTVRTTDPTWNWGTGAKDPVTGIREPKTGDLWVPHVYVPAQNPADISGMNATGRWHYGPWFWPPVTNIENPPIPNPYYDPINAPWEPALMPATPNPSMGMENYNDTPLVNGTPYPYMNVEPKPYRFRILNAANDRFFNLQMYVADETTQAADGRLNTEVKMVPASNTETYFPELWPTDGRAGGVPDPRTAGPDFIQIATEGGFLPKPAVVPAQPITWNTDPTTFNMGNVEDHSLLLGNAERADVIVDFSKYKGKTLILYNDAPTAFPALDPRTDYYTGAPDMTDTGGTTTPEVGMGPNTRTIMQIRVSDTGTPVAFDMDKLNAAFTSTDTTQGVFESSQNPIIVPDSRYDGTYNESFTPDPYVRIYQNKTSFKTLEGTVATISMEPKAIQDEQGETFDPKYGRMSAKLGLEMPGTNATNANFITYGFIDPPTENLTDQMTPLSPILQDGTQIWKITHNGVDTHPVHFHLYDVQVINRVGWDGGIRPPDDNELGWKDTVRVSPLEDTIVALKPVTPKMPFGVPDSIRPLNPAEPIGSTMDFTNFDPVTGEQIVPPITNQMYNFKWEYVWHCHILSHEEMDMMRPVSVSVNTDAPDMATLSHTRNASQVTLTWVDPTPVAAPTTLGNPKNEIGFRIERAAVGTNGQIGAWTQVGSALANATTFIDAPPVATTTYQYRVVAYNVSGERASLAVTAYPPGGGKTVRVSNGDRYASAVAAAQLAFPNWEGVTDVVIASGADANQPDALTASGLAGAYNGPLLLVQQTALPSSVSAALAAMPDGVKVHVVGGTSAVADSVMTSMDNVAGVDQVERVPMMYGTNRYATAAGVATRMKAVLGPDFPTSTIIANGAESTYFFDALSASPVASKKHFPILLVSSTSVPSQTTSALSALGLTKRYIVGGTNSVSGTVATQLGVAPADRISGGNRYATAVAVANRAKTEGWLAFGLVGASSTIPDSLVGGTTLGTLGGPLLLTSTTTLPTETRNFLTANKAEVQQVYAFGGTSVMPNSVIAAINTALQ